MILSNRALMGAEEPSFQQRDHAMGSRKQVFSILLMPLYLAVVDISVQSQIGGQTVGSDCASWRNGLSDEPVQAGLGHIWDRTQTDTANAFSIFLGGDDNQGLSSVRLPIAPVSSPPQ